MAKWRFKPPGRFPMDFHRAMLEGPGVDKLVCQTYTYDGIKSRQWDFMLFRYCLRKDPGHPTSSAEFLYRHRTRVAYDPHRQLWQLLLTSREDVSTGMNIHP